MDIANFAYANTPHTSTKNTVELIESLEKASNTLFQWFKHNIFKGNPGKFRLIVTNNQKTNVNLEKFNIDSSDCEKLLGIKIDNKLTFDCHISGRCKKASIKINAIVSQSSTIYKHRPTTHTYEFIL